MTQKAKEAAGMYSIGTIDLYQFLDACTSIEEAKEAMDIFEVEALPIKVELIRACKRAKEISDAWASYNLEARRNRWELIRKRLEDENPEYPSYEEWMTGLEQLHKTYTEEELQAAYDNWEYDRYNRLFSIGYMAAAKKVSNELIYKFFRDYHCDDSDMRCFYNGYFCQVYGFECSIEQTTKL